MAKAQVINRRAKGLDLQFNPFLSTEGSLAKADNCVIDREGIIGRREGLNRYGNQLSSGALAIVGEYKDRLHGHLSGKLFWDSNGLGTWTSASTFNPPDQYNRIRGTEVRSNFYVTTSKGLFKKDTLAATPIRAGMRRAPDLTFDLKVVYGVAGTTTGWFLPDTRVGYRVLFKRKDANKFELRSAPCPRREVANATVTVTLDWSAGRTIVYFTQPHGLQDGHSLQISNAGEPTYNGTFAVKRLSSTVVTYALATQPAQGRLSDVSATAGRFGHLPQIRYTLPFGHRDGDQYEFYRTKMSAGASVPPGDRLFRIREKEIPAGQLPGDSLFFVDDVDEVFLDAEIYTSPNLETILQANDPPPLALDTALFDGRLHFANIKDLHRLELVLEDLTRIDVGLSTLTIQDGVTTFVMNAATAENVAARNFLKSTAEPTTAQNIEETCRSIVNVVNQNQSHLKFQASYISGDDDTPGRILFYAREYDQAAFWLTVDTANTGAAFSPVLPTSGQTVISENDHRPNGLAVSKFEEPDHVPLANWDPVGSEEDPIQRILALRDSLIIFKDEDGVWRKDKNGVISQLDPNIRLFAPESAVVLNDAVYGFTNQGVVRVTENGSVIVSRGIEDDLMKRHQIFDLATPANDYRNLIHAAADEENRKYLLFVPAVGAITVTECFCYNYLTDGGVWTKWLMNARAARVVEDAASMNNQKTALMVAANNESYILKARVPNQAGGLEFQDHTLSMTVDSVSTTLNTFGETVTTLTVTYTESVHPLAEGFAVTQGALVNFVTAVVANGGNSFTLTLDVLNAAWAPGAASAHKNIPAEIEWQPEDAGDQFTLKHWVQAIIYLETPTAKFHDLGFKTEEAAQVFVNQIRGSVRKLRTLIPRAAARSAVQSLTYQNLYARDDFRITGMSLVFRPGGSLVTQLPR